MPVKDLESAKSYLETVCFSRVDGDDTDKAIGLLQEKIQQNKEFPGVESVTEFDTKKTEPVKTYKEKWNKFTGGLSKKFHKVLDSASWHQQGTPQEYSMERQPLQ